MLEADAVAVARQSMIEYATTDLLPEGLNVTLLVAGSLFTGRHVRPSVFIESVKLGIAGAVRAENATLAATFEAVDVSDMEYDLDAPFVHFQCDTWVSPSGVTSHLGGAVFRFRRAAVDGFVFGTLSVEQR